MCFTTTQNNNNKMRVEGRGRLALNPYRYDADTCTFINTDTTHITTDAYRQIFQTEEHYYSNNIIFNSLPLYSSPPSPVILPSHPRNQLCQG